MHARRFVRFALVGAAVALALNCADRMPTSSAPAAPAAPDALLGELLQPTGLLRCIPLPYDSVTQTIGPEGGRIKAGPHVLTVPAGALPTPVSITAVVPSRPVNTIRLQPEGLEFTRSATLAMSYANCNTLGSLLPKRIAYVSDLLAILYYLPSVDDLLAKKVRGRLDHFSEYAVAW